MAEARILVVEDAVSTALRYEGFDTEVAGTPRRRRCAGPSAGPDGVPNRAG